MADLNVKLLEATQRLGWASRGGFTSTADGAFSALAADGTTGARILCNGIQTNSADAGAGLSLNGYYGSIDAFQWVMANGTGYIGLAGTGSYNDGDVRMYRDGANQWALRNGTNAQKLSVYNTYTSATDYEAFTIDWQATANTCRLEVGKGTSGTYRSLEIRTGGTAAMTVNTSGIVLRNDNAMGTATSDIFYSSSSFAVRSQTSFNVIIDSDNNATTEAVWFRKNNAAVASATKILGVLESGVLTFGDSAAGVPALKPSSTELQVRLGDDSADAPLKCGTFTVSGATVTLGEGCNLVAGTTTGTKIGTGTTQKLGFWDATPVVQQVLATGGGATVDDVITFLQTVGLCKQS